MITQNIVSGSKLTGTPNNTSGLLITDKTAGLPNFVFQTFKERPTGNTESGKIYVRSTDSANGGNAWLPWKPLA